MPPRSESLRATEVYSLFMLCVHGHLEEALLHVLFTLAHRLKEQCLLERCGGEKKKIVEAKLTTKSFAKVKHINFKLYCMKQVTWPINELGEYNASLGEGKQILVKNTIQLNNAPKFSMKRRLLK